MVRVPEPWVKLEMPPGAELDPFLVVGWDQSLNHAGIVVLDHLGELDDYLYLATLARDAKRCRGATRIPSEITGQKDKAMRSARRLVWIGKWLDSVIGYLDEIAAGRLVYVSIEDYAYAAGHGTFSLSDGFITERGIAHRCGSVVTDLPLPVLLLLFNCNFTERQFYSSLTFKFNQHGLLERITADHLGHP